MKTTAFGRHLRKLRIDHGMIMRDLADAMEVSSAFVSALELGKKPISDKHINQVTEHFKLSVAETHELKRSADISQPSVKIDLTEQNENNRELAVSFARNYQNMSIEDQRRLMKMLEG